MKRRHLALLVIAISTVFLCSPADRATSQGGTLSGVVVAEREDEEGRVGLDGSYPAEEGRIPRQQD